MSSSDSHHRLLVDPPPDPNPRPPRLLELPPGAVDAHAHVIGDVWIDERSYTPRPAAARDYLRMLDAVGMQFGVLVQVSVHGTDNSLMLNTVAANRHRLRGIAVVPHNADDALLTTLKDGAVVGLRLNTTTGGGVGIQHLERYAAICEELEWHLELLIEPHQLPDLVKRVAAVQVPVVFDHMGYVQPGTHMNAAREALLQLVRDGAWAKLSGGFRLSSKGPPYPDVQEFTSTLAEIGAKRCIWGSDWPHVKFRGHMPNPGELLDLLAESVPRADLQEAILVDNPHRLYGFASAAQ